MKFKRLVLILLAVAMLSVFAACSGEEPADTPNYEGLNIVKMEGGYYLVEGQHYTGETLVIPFSAEDGMPITEIGSFAFINLTQLKKVTIGGNIEEIGASAFSGCTGLTEMDIPGGVERIATEAFENCTALKSVKMTSSLFGMGSDVFAGCTALTDITYSGKTEDWTAAQKYWSKRWLGVEQPVTVHCADGEILLNAAE